VSDAYELLAGSDQLRAECSEIRKVAAIVQALLPEQDDEMEHTLVEVERMLAEPKFRSIGPMPRSMVSDV
jgi:hypothetical protein